MLSVEICLDPLLKRPFSIHRWLGHDFQVLYRVVGKATALLKMKKTGDSLEIMGPLGNGFPPAEDKPKKILVAGGLGIAALFSLAESIINCNPVLFLGARNKKELLCMNVLRSIGIKPVVTTDDGSLGSKGMITAKVEEYLDRHSSQINDHCIYACGPKPMLKRLSVLLKRLGLQGYFALEENMACGLGACLGCVVNTSEGFKRVCKEGPVFSVEDIVW